MKRFLVLFIMGSVLLSSCAVSKIEREAQRTVDGNWVLTKISYPNSSTFVDVQLFQDASSRCFPNSKWTFVNNNNQGHYVLKDSDCISGNQKFTWNIIESSSSSSGFFMTLKPINEGQNAQEVEAGFQMELTRLDQNTMVWRETVNYRGDPFIIQMKFKKQ